MSTATVRIYEVLYDVNHPGPAADGTVIYRSKSKREAETFASTRTCYGKPAEALAANVSRRLAERWGVA